jgi:8-oxo-dGTP pyrophosphatase MutT (NUDIX family)
MKNAAIGIVFSEDKKSVLLVLRRDLPLWVLPGGGIEDGETAESTVVRELFEETGISVQIQRKVGVYIPINRLASQTEVFECTPKEKIPEQLHPQLETARVSFFPLDALPKTFFFLHKEWLDDAIYQKMPVLKPMNSITWKKAAALLIRHPLYSLRYIFSRVCKYNSV